MRIRREGKRVEGEGKETPRFLSLSFRNVEKIKPKLEDLFFIFFFFSNPPASSSLPFFARRATNYALLLLTAGTHD
jgi:hypothetical protein